MRILLLMACFAALANYHWPAVQIGIAHTPDEVTGVTTVVFEPRAQVAVDIRGGAPGTVFTPDWMVDGHGELDAIVLSGGSLLGMGAVHGVSKAIYDARDKAVGWLTLPYVSGAIIYDFHSHQTSSFPGPLEGQNAYLNRAEVLPAGRFGAGRGASVNKLFNLDDKVMLGQAVQYAEFGELKILVVSVLNSLGAIIGPDGKLLVGQAGVEALQAMPEGLASGNTTITAVVINQSFTARELKQMARQIHMALGSVITPFGTSFDGDVLYLASTNEIPSSGVKTHVATAALAGEVLKSAVWALAEEQKANETESALLNALPIEEN